LLLLAWYSIFSALYVSPHVFIIYLRALFAVLKKKRKNSERERDCGWMDLAKAIVATAWSRRRCMEKRHRHKVALARLINEKGLFTCPQRLYDLQSTK
jgi:hypothetical protein